MSFCATIEQACPPAMADIDWAGSNAGARDDWGRTKRHRSRNAAKTRAHSGPGLAPAVFGPTALSLKELHCRCYIQATYMHHVAQEIHLTGFFLYLGTGTCTGLSTG